jgi:hypothetical protein
MKIGFFRKTHEIVTGGANEDFILRRSGIPPCFDLSLQLS